MRAEEVIALLGLQPLPDEGGMWTQTWLDPLSSAIQYLLRPDDFSRLHRLAGVEVYHHYAGAPADLVTLSPDGQLAITRLGDDLAAGQRPTAVVPAGTWQASATRGDWTLLGTTMAPPFNPEGFELADPDELSAAFPRHAGIIRALSRPPEAP